MRSREQKLVDICFSCALMISDPAYGFTKKPIEERAAWVAEQLRACGFNTVPVGMSWGVLRERQEKTP